MGSPGSIFGIFAAWLFRAALGRDRCWHTLETHVAVSAYLRERISDGAATLTIGLLPTFASVGIAAAPYSTSHANCARRLH